MQGKGTGRISFEKGTVRFDTKQAGHAHTTETMKKRILFVVNPISGTGNKSYICDEIEENLDVSLFDYEIKFTERKGHASELTKEAVGRSVDICVAVGGDGTVNEVARSVIHTQTALGIIPCGSGNGLARHLQIPQNAKRAIAIINKDTIHTLDYGRINGYPFFCTCGMGFDAFVSEKFAESGKRGLLSYVRNTVKAGLRYKAQTYVIKDDKGVETHEAFLIACANASQYGNNAYIAPRASMKDGLMDIVIMKPFKTIEGAQVALQMFTKTLSNNSHIETFKAKKVHISRPCEGPVHCDGEPMIMGKELDVELISNSFNVVINPDEHKRWGLLQDVTDYVDEMFRSFLNSVDFTLLPTKDRRQK